MSLLRRRHAELARWIGRSIEGPAVVDLVLRQPPAGRAAWLKAHHSGTEVHTLNALLDAAYASLDDAPEESAAIARLVLEVLGAVSPKAMRTERRIHLQGRAWNELASALRMTGDLLGSCRAYQTAAGIFATSEHGQLELAGSKRGEALVRHQLGESNVALEMLRMATHVCDMHGDQAGVGRCLLYEGAIHYGNGDFRAARAAFESVLVISCDLGDRKTVARLQLNLGNCALERGDRGSAMRDFGHAMDYFEAEGMRADYKRVTWAVAQLLADDGFVELALRTLEDVALTMDAAGFRVDAALARHDIIEVLVLAGRVDRAAPIVRHVLDTFAAAGLFQEAMRTITVLHGATVRQRTGTVDQS